MRATWPSTWLTLRNDPQGNNFTSTGVIMKYHPNTLGIIKCATPGSRPRTLIEIGLTGRKIKNILPSTTTTPAPAQYCCGVELRHMLSFLEKKALGYMAEWRSCLGRGTLKLAAETILHGEKDHVEVIKWSRGYYPAPSCWLLGDRIWVNRTVSDS